MNNGQIALISRKAFVSVDAISGEINLWQSSVAKAPQVAKFCFKQAQLAAKNGFQKLYIVLDNNKTHLKAMKTIFNQMLLTDNNLSTEVVFKHTASYAPKYNPAEYIIAIIRRKYYITWQLILQSSKYVRG